MQISKEQIEEMLSEIDKHAYSVRLDGMAQLLQWFLDVETRGFTIPGILACIKHTVEMEDK